jgi:cytochrome c oxidase subunit IV
MEHQSTLSTTQDEVDKAHYIQEQSHRATYITVFLILGVLTFFEVFIPEIYAADYSSITKMLLLCVLAFGKAALVALYFMHLKYESPWLRWIGYTPIYMGFAVIIIMLETVYR